MSTHVRSSMYRDHSFLKVRTTYHALVAQYKVKLELGPFI